MPTAVSLSSLIIISQLGGDVALWGAAFTGLAYSIKTAPKDGKGFWIFL